MTEDQLLTALRNRLLPNVGGAAVVRNFDNGPREAASAIYMHHVTTRRYGWMSSRRVVEEDAIRTIQTQTLETVIQFSGLGDSLRLAAFALQGEEGIIALRAAGVAVLRVGEIRNPFIVNDRDQFEASPSFDLVCNHDDVFETVTPIVESTTVTVERV